ncbi:UNVERIFIED_CONTAM: hypothetical protein GTU68_034290 [Idotea baltica]|nr:hypothetical protein [Idotea baltica]
MGFETATPVQEQAMPHIMEGRDILACAQTGTGKTAAFILPVLNALAKNPVDYIDTVVVAPTRELAQQIDKEIQAFSYFAGAESFAVYGGGGAEDFEKQKRALTKGANIIVATPGKLISHLNMGYVKFEKAVSSDLDQKDREDAIRRFRSGETRVIVATDVLSRGIDIKGINLVINYDVPNDAEDYVHRIGRTARADSTGVAITVINPDDMYKFAKIEKLIEREVPKIPLPKELGEGPEWSTARSHGGGRGGNRKGGGRGGNRNHGGGNRHNSRNKPSGNRHQSSRNNHKGSKK